MNVLQLGCPKCGAQLDIDPGKVTQGFCFCNYCGAKVVINDENEYTIRIVDEAKLKELELRESSTTSSNAFFKKRIKYYAIGFVLGEFIAFLLGFESKAAMAFLFLSGMCMVCLFYGSIIHGIILLKKRKK